MPRLNLDAPSITSAVAIYGLNLTANEIKELVKAGHNWNSYPGTMEALLFYKNNFEYRIERYNNLYIKESTHPDGYFLDINGVRHRIVIELNSFDSAEITAKNNTVAPFFQLSDFATPAQLERLKKTFTETEFIDFLDDIKNKFVTSIENKPFNIIEQERSYGAFQHNTMKNCLTSALGGTLSFYDSLAKSMKYADDSEIPFIRYSSLREPRHYIVAVYELQNNVRLAFIQDMAYNTLKVISFTPGHKWYDYVDPGRLCFISSLEGANPIIIADTDKVLESLEKFQHQTLRALLRKYANSNKDIITKEEFLKAVKTEEYEKEQEQIENEQKSLFKQKIDLKIEKLKDDTPFLLNDVTYYKDKFEYQGQSFTIDPKYRKSNNSKNWVSLLLQLLVKSYNYDLTELTFDRIFDITLNSIQEKIVSPYHTSDSISFSGKLGDVDIEVTKNFKKARTTINNIRINQGEVKELLKRATCYSSTEEYNVLLKRISSCSLNFYKHLDEGIAITNIADDLKRINGKDKVSLLFKIIRKKNKNYLSTSEGEFKIVNSNSFFRIKNFRLWELGKTLLDPKVIEGIDSNNLYKILTDASNNFLLKQNSSTALLNNTVKMFNIESLDNIKFSNGTTLDKGYKIKGKLREYIIDRENKNSVFEYPTGKYLCIIDKDSEFSEGSVKRLVNRIFALHNDKLITQHVDTLVEENK